MSDPRQEGVGDIKWRPLHLKSTSLLRTLSVSSRSIGRRWRTSPVRRTKRGTRIFTRFWWVLFIACLPSVRKWWENQAAQQLQSWSFLAELCLLQCSNDLFKTVEEGTDLKACLANNVSYFTFWILNASFETHCPQTSPHHKVSLWCLISFQPDWLITECLRLMACI